MKIIVQNFRGAKELSFEHEKLTFIGGKNHNGKSSIFQAAGAVLTGEVLPISGVGKSKVKKLIHEGQKTAACKIMVDDSAAGISWPDCKSYREGTDVPLITKVAAGVESLIDLPKKDRPALMANYINTKPTNDELTEALKKEDVPETYFDKLIDGLEINGWDTMFARAKEAGSRLKGQWEGITGENFGSRKIADWYPPTYYVALGARTEEELKGILSEAIANHEAAIAADAVAGLELEDLKQRAASKDAIEKDQRQHATQLAKMDQDMEAENKKIRDLSNMPEEKACPHCGGIVQIEGREIVPYRALTDEEVEDRTVKLREAHDKIAELEAARKEVQERNYKLLQALKDATAAAGELKKAEAAKASEAWAGKTEEARKALEKARDDLTGWQLKKKADEVSGHIIANLAIQKVLNPKGLRKDIAAREIGQFNIELSEAAQAAHWADVRIDNDFMVFHGGRPVELCSRSEKYQARIVLQTILAKREKSAQLMIDDADIIVGQERNGVFQLLMWADIPAIIFMSLGDKDGIPNVGKIGGAAYWVESGEIEKCQK